MIKKTILVLLLAAIPAAAQKTTVTATIVDPTGIPYANGTVTAQLVPAGVSNATVNGAAIGGLVGPAATDDNGHFSMDLFSNTSISPANTKWQFTVCNPGVPSPLGFGNQCFMPAPITITGSTQSVTAQMNAVAPQLTRLSGINVTPGPPTGACNNGAIAVDSTTGVIYTCQGGAWVSVTVTSSSGAPGGTCSPNQLYVNTATGQLYTCSGTTWVTGAGSGTVTSFSSGNLSQLFSTSVSNPTTTPTLSFSATSVPPNSVYSGPAAAPGTTSYYFDNAVIATGSGTSQTITGTPATASESVLFFGTAAFGSQGSPYPTPAGGGWVSLDTNTRNSAGLFSKSLGSSSSITVTDTIASAGWSAMLAFVGSSAAPTNNGSINVVSGATSPGTYTGSITPVGGESILVWFTCVFVTTPPSGFTVTDDQGNTWIPIAQVSNGSNTAQFAAIAPNAAAAATNVSIVITGGNFNGGIIDLYRLGNVTSFATGANGPPSFKLLAPSFVQSALGVTQIQSITICASGCDVTATPCTALGSGASYSQCQNTITWPLPFKDANYSVVCGGVGPRDPANAPNVGRAYLQVFDANNGFAKTATQFTLNTVATGNSDVHFDEFDCTGIHH